jgi:HEAT repeat protein
MTMLGVTTAQKLIRPYGGTVSQHQPGQVFTPFDTHVAVLLVYATAKYARIAAYAQDSLRALGTPAVPLLLEYFANDETDDSGSSDPQLAPIIASVLAQQDDEQVIPPLIQALYGRNRQIRQQAAVFLCQRTSTAAVGPLLGLLHDPDRDTRKIVVNALGRLGDLRALAPLQQLQQDRDVATEDDEIRLAVDEAIRRIQAQQQVP